MKNIMNLDFPEEISKDMSKMISKLLTKCEINVRIDSTVGNRQPNKKCV